MANLRSSPSSAAYFVHYYVQQHSPQSFFLPLKLILQRMKAVHPAADAFEAELSGNHQQKESFEGGSTWVLWREGYD